MKIHTIGFTEKSAEEFFGLLKSSGAKRVVDVRLNNVSQLAGFAKKKDLAYFVQQICGMEYVHVPELAPTKEMLDEYKKNGGQWAAYEQRFLDLMKFRNVQDTISREIIEDGCLLCSEHLPHQCHRRLVAEYLNECWGTVEIEHHVEQRVKA
jgi:uncharacterized protein (DUF488 family)